MYPGAGHRPEGKPLSGENKYTLTLPGRRTAAGERVLVGDDVQAAGEPAGVDKPDQPVSDQPPMLPNLTKNPDGSLTFPSRTTRRNPTGSPTGCLARRGPFTIFMRLPAEGRGAQRHSRQAPKLVKVSQIPRRGQCLVVVNSCSRLSKIAPAAIRATSTTCRRRSSPRQLPARSNWRSPASEEDGSYGGVPTSPIPISTGLGRRFHEAQPGIMRELHWHADAAEWASVVSGRVRTTLVDPAGHSETSDFAPGDVWYFPRGHGHRGAGQQRAPPLHPHLRQRLLPVSSALSASPTGWAQVPGRDLGEEPGSRRTCCGVTHRRGVLRQRSDSTGTGGCGDERSGTRRR